MAGLVLGSCCYLPYLTGESAHGWQNSRGMIDGGPIRYAAGTLEAFVAPVSFLLNYWAPKWAYTAAEYRELSRVTFGGPGEAVATNVLSTMVALFLTVGGILASSEGLRGFWRSPRQVFAASPGIVFLSVIFVVPLAASVLVGQPFHPRYALVLLAPLFALAGAGALRWFRHERFGRLFTTLLCVAVAANIWFMPRMFRFQDRLIETSARFIPSFYNLELVYQALVHHAGDHRVVALSDEAYLLGLTPKDDRWLRGAALLRRYINVRNLEQGLPGDSVSRASYILRRESDVETGAADVAYRGNGIAIVASPLPPP